MVISVTQVDRIKEISDRVHDLWIDFDVIRTTRGSSRVSIELFREAESSEPYGVLTINDVKEIDVEDTQRIGRYDIREIDYDSSRRHVLFRMNIPSTLVVTVGQFNLELLVPEIMKA